MNEELQNVDVNTEELEAPKTYTQEEVMALLQSEADKRVQQALKKQQKKYEKQLSLSGLDEQQRAQAEKDMRIAELEEKLKEFNVMQTKNEITKVLSARGLNPQFADLINIGEDIEEAQQRIDLLDKLFKAQVKAEVEKRINSTNPKTSTVALQQGMTKEKLAMLPAEQQYAYLMEHPDFI